MAITTQVNKRTTISTAIDSGSTSFTLASAVFTNMTSGYLVLDYDNPTLLEVVKCSVSGSTVTIIARAQDGTSAQDHAIGAKVGWNLVKSDFDSILAGTAGFSFDKCHVNKTTNQSINNGSQTTITWDSEQFDTNSMHSNVTNNSRITIVNTGYYLVSAQLAWEANTTGRRFLTILKNGSPFAVDLSDNRAATSAGEGRNSLTVIVALTAGDYIEVQGLQNSGGALNVASYSYFLASLLA